MLPARHLEPFTLVFHGLITGAWLIMWLSSQLASDSFRVSCRWINCEADSSDSVLDIQQVVFDVCRVSSVWCPRNKQDNSEQV